MKPPCTTHKSQVSETINWYYKLEKGHKQRQCPTCLRWYFHGEFGEGWKGGVKYSETSKEN